MKLRIVKAKYPLYWYASRIGETFDIIPDIGAENSERYRVKMKRPHIGHFYVHFSDCEVVGTEAADE